MLTKLLTLALTCMLVAVMMTACMTLDSHKLSIYTDDQAIIGDGDTYSYKQRVSGDTMEYVDFTGMETVARLDLPEDMSVHVNILSSVRKGEFKCVLITPTDELYLLAEHHSTSNINLDLPAGESRIKIVGKRASGEFGLSIEAAGEHLVTR